MRYLAELYYLQNQGDFPFQQAVRVTATAISRSCSHFYAKVLAPVSKQVGSAERSGPLPEDVQDKEVFVAKVVDWLFESSMNDELFCLLLDDEPVPKSGKAAKLAHYDDTCCWELDLSESEFAELQSIWKASGLPEDLFYPDQVGVCVLYPGTGLKARLLRAFGVQRCYTPKQWESEMKGKTG